MASNQVATPEKPVHVQLRRAEDEYDAEVGVVAFE